MTLSISLISSNYSTALIISLLFLISPSYSTNKDLMVAEDKARLGSMPPSCHNKCNQCHPCTAVQVAAKPSCRSVDPVSGQEKYSDPSSSGDRYSNYKPLGWKCDCKGRYYNP